MKGNLLKTFFYGAAEITPISGNRIEFRDPQRYSGDQKWFPKYIWLEKLSLLFPLNFFYFLAAKKQKSKYHIVHLTALIGSLRFYKSNSTTITVPFFALSRNTSPFPSQTDSDSLISLSVLVIVNAEQSQTYK